MKETYMAVAMNNNKHRHDRKGKVRPGRTDRDRNLDRARHFDLHVDLHHRGSPSHFML
jgi:hypothetical protein